MSPTNTSPPRSNLDAALELLGHAGGVRVVPVTGPSMLPTLADGDGIAVDLGARDLRAGDLALFRQSDGLVVHRFLRRVTRSRRGAHFRFRGDGRPSFDPPVTEDDLRGVVRAIRRGSEWWSLEGAGARLWARAIAWHARFWGLKFSVARTLFGRPDPAVPPPWPARWIARVDRFALRVADRVLFRVLHRRAAPPAAG